GPLVSSEAGQPGEQTRLPAARSSFVRGASWHCKRNPRARANASEHAGMQCVSLGFFFGRARRCGGGGGGWIRTSVDVSRQIYSLLPLTTRPPLQRNDHAVDGVAG